MVTSAPGCMVPWILRLNENHDSMGVWLHVYGVVLPCPAIWLYDDMKRRISYMFIANYCIWLHGYVPASEQDLCLTNRDGYMIFLCD